MVSVDQPQHAIVRDILANAGRPMPLAEICAEVRKLGIETRATMRSWVTDALQRRKTFAGDVRMVRPGIWEFCKN
jgi:hypothetical protein